MTTSSTRTYPLEIEGQLQLELSRGLWLVKWVLVIPHLIVLVFLGLAFVLSTVIAFFGILFTGRYPRGIFDFSVGVLRWGWRVGFYSYSALATDEYPPFSLGEVPDYPTRLDVEYPGELSRGKVLVKWWLLALPQYLIISVFTGGAWAGVTGDNWFWAGGLIGLLALIAGVALLVNRRYPEAIFDLVMGLNRWVFRVIAYAALMTDVYPPFRLDMGGGETLPVEHLTVGSSTVKGLA